MVSHDAAVGKLERCQITGSQNLNLVIDLGHQPLCDALLTKEQLGESELTYPLRLMHCPESGLAQLDYVVESDAVYPPSYPYRSGISKPLEEYQRQFADKVVARFSLEAGAFVVDVGSNDGTLLTGFKRCGMRVLGVEPTDVALIAQKENQIETLQRFFNEGNAKEIESLFGRAALITMTNVFAHMRDLGEVMRGISALLAQDGIFISESHYLLDVLEKNQFDTIYHEHIRTYSLKSLVLLFPQYGMEVFDFERGDRYGGNIRVYVCWKGRHEVSTRVGAQLVEEDARGLHDPSSWKAWRNRVLINRDKFMEWLYVARTSGALIGGKSCPGRAATLINFYGITPDLVPYLGELQNSLKLGKFLPGAHIPVLSEQVIFRQKPDFLILFAWHYGEVIAERLQAAGLGSVLVVPLPEFDFVKPGKRGN